MTDGPFSYRQGEELADAMARHGVFPRKDPDNGRRLVAALRDLGYPVDDRLEGDLLAGKDFVQIRTGPFDLDLVFAPDGIESFDEAKARSVLVAGRFPVAHIDDIIRSKRAANRAKDRESLPRLEAFAAHLRSKR